MKYCIFCNNLMNEDDNSCLVCGKKVNFNEEKHNDTKINKSLFVFAVIFTVAYLVIYVLGIYFSNWLEMLGKGLNGGEEVGRVLDLKELCFFSMLFSFFPWLWATILALVSKKKKLLLFNLMFFLINLFLFFL